MVANICVSISVQDQDQWLRELTKKGSKFVWKSEHDACFKDLINSFKKEVLLRYFDPALNTFILVDGHKTGLGAMLAQGTSLNDAKPVAVASRSTSTAEQNYPQLDLEAVSLDFGLRRFREYVVGSPTLSLWYTYLMDVAVDPLEPRELNSTIKIYLT